MLTRFGIVLVAVATTIVGGNFLVTGLFIPAVITLAAASICFTVAMSRKVK